MQMASVFARKPKSGRTEINPSTLHKVLIVWRHGDYTPENFIPSDPENSENTWPTKSGHVTDEGIRQHYYTGNYLRSLYITGNTY